MSCRIPLLFVFIVFQALYASAQDKIIEVWPDNIPGAISNDDYREIPVVKDGKLSSTSKVTNPTLSVFIPEKQNGTAIVIFPGGGYQHLSMDKEGSKVAQWLNSIGITAFVLKYRLPSDKIMQNKAIGALQDAQESIRILRRRAKEWNINPDRIGIMGFSAGGHLGASLSTKFNEKLYPNTNNISARPDFSALIYPVISMKKDITHMGSRRNLLGESPSISKIEKFSNEMNVGPATPPVFLVHAADDKAVPVENSIRYFLATKSFDIPSELHIYDKGGHGFGLGNTRANKSWSKTFKNWLQAHKYVPQDSVFIFSYFKGNGEDGLHLAYSEDGYDWKALKEDQSFLKPELGNEKLMRDPNIIKGGDGQYHMVWTVGWTEKGIGYASSKDLINWSEQKYIPVMEHEENARNSWAPEITYDPENDIYMIYWATTIKGKFPETQSDMENNYNHRIYYTTTKDFKDFAATELLYEPGFNVIDASIKKEGDKFVMFLKNETREPEEKNIRVAFSDSLTGPYGKASEPITGDYWAEGPTAIKIDGEWIVYFDKYTLGEYGAVSSPDLKNWKDISQKINFPDGARHGTVLKVSREILENLQRR